MPETPTATPRSPRTGNLIHPPEHTDRSTRRKQRVKTKPLKRAGIGSICLLVLLVCLAYAPIFESDVLWTEHDLPERSAYESMQNWTDAWTPASLRGHDPLSPSSYFTEQALALPTPQVHRAINLLLHLVAAFLLLRNLETLKLPAAFPVTLVFALHPTNLQTLFWPGYRSELFGLIFVLAALYFGIRNRGSRDYLLTVLLTAAAILVHPVALVLPAVLALAILLREKHLHIASFNRVLPLLCLSLFLGVWTSSGGTAAGEDTNLTGQLNQTGQNMFFYIGQSLFPLGAELFYPLAPDSNKAVGAQLSLLPFLLFVPFFILIAFNLKKTWARAILLGLSAYLLFIIPGVMEGGRFIDGRPAHEDHGLYIALPALLALIVGGSAGLFRKIGPGGSVLWGIAFSIFLMLQIAVTATSSYAVGEPARMWQGMVDRWPQSWVAKVAFLESLPNQETIQLDNQEKIVMLNEILDQQPERMTLRIDLARTYRAEGQNSNALREYLRVFRENNPGKAFLEEAAAFFESAGLRWEAANARERIRAKNTDAGSSAEPPR